MSEVRGGASDEVRERLRGWAKRTDEVRASTALTRRLVELPAARAARREGLASAIVRFAIPSLVVAALATVGLFVLDGARDPLDEDVALAALGGAP